MLNVGCWMLDADLLLQSAYYSLCIIHYALFIIQHSTFIIQNNPPLLSCGQGIRFFTIPDIEQLRGADFEILGKMPVQLNNDCLCNRNLPYALKTTPIGIYQVCKHTACWPHLGTPVTNGDEFKQAE